MSQPAAVRQLLVPVAVVVALIGFRPVPTGAVEALPTDGAVGLLVGWRPGTTPSAAAAAVLAAGGEVVDGVAPLNVAVVAVPARLREVALAGLRADASVAYAEADQEVTAAEVMPTDPLWSGQWGPVVTRTPLAWDTTTGSASVVIAVVDSGVDPTHPDLVGALVPGTDLVNGDSDPADDFGHGTSVAGIAAARGSNGVGIAGYCWTCSVMAIKVLDDKGLGSVTNVAAGIVVAADRGARVINLSLSAPSPTTTLANAVAYARARGALVIASAGNDGDPIPNYPAATPGALGVAATDIADGRYSFSSFGPWAELGAPGCHVAPRQQGGMYRTLCGTSSASPAVAGIAGLLLSARPAATLADLERALLLAANPVGAGITSAYGRLDAAAAMAAIVAPVAVPMPGSTVPGAPTGVSATAGNGSATVRWGPPLTDGGNPVTGFRVTASPGGTTAEVGPGATSFTLGPLTNGVTYSLGVSALNAAGTGPATSAPPPLVRPLLTGLERVAGAGRVETAVALSRRVNPGAAEVVVARSDDYADALTAAPLAATVHVPLLLSPPDQLPAVVASEVVRLGARRAVLVGGLAALSAEVEAGLRAVGVTTIDRVAGENRFDTARQLAIRVGGRSVYLTEGANEDPTRGWPDAVAVSGLAAFQARPILLATRDELPAETRAAMAALGTTAATVVGGPAAVSEAVAVALGDPDGDGLRQVTVTRLGGATRWDTSRLVADRTLAVGAGVHRLWIATGRDWPDALAAGPAAASKAAVILLVDGQDLSASPAASAWLTLQNRRFLEVVLVGGTTPITPEVEAGLSALLR